jgi:dipeptidyl aminopeptidase/acylaminoacyl peptidase
MLNLTQLLRVPQLDIGLLYDISSDGRNVVFSWNKTGNWEIYELEISPGIHEARETKLITKGKGSKFAPRYSPDGKYIAYALDLDGSESYHVVLQNLATDLHIDLTPTSAYAHQPNFAFSPDGKTLAILADQHGQFALYLLAIETGEKELLLDVHRPMWDVKWSPDGRWIAVEVEMEASDRGILVVDIASGKWKQLESLNAQQPVWSPDSKFVAFSAESGEWFDIGLYDAEIENIEWLTHSTGDDTSPCWSVDGERVSWVHAEGAANSLMVWKGGVPVKRYQACLAQGRRVSAGIHHQPRFTSNNEILFLFESPKQPPDLWKLNVNGTFGQLTNSLPDDFRNADFILPEEISFDSDGMRVPALLYRGGGECAVIDIHGGPNWHVQFSWNPLAAHLASRGWTVLLPNYRGSTGYGRTWQMASRYDMGGVDTRDCAAGVQYLLKEGLAKKFAVTGRSHGGYLTMTCLTQFQDLWYGGSAVVPFMNWFKSHDDSREDLQHWNIENMGDPKENYERWYNASPYFFLDRINAPVQLICGGNDPRCPATDSLDARDKLIALGKDVDLLLYEGEGHSFLKIENVIDAELRRVEFLARVLEK